MQTLWLVAGALNGLVSVAMGAFGAHALKNLPEPFLGHVKTGAQYEMYHALALVLIALLPRHGLVTTAGTCFLAGSVIFAGSLYVLALTQQRWWGAVTPIGGVLMIAGWAALAAYGVVARRGT
jgi:uncharacterized membrane protein YgdD (TMEM256/DUF423 family)